MSVPPGEAPTVPAPTRDALHEPPPPPRGPGVAAPFAAPPNDRDNKGLWIGLSVGALVLVLCCAGGIGGIALLSGLPTTQAITVVSEYLDALVEEDYDAAYQMLCTERTRALDRSGFARQVGRDPVESYEIGDVVVGQSEFVVTAQVTTTERGETSQEFRVLQEGAELKVCPPL